MKYIRTPLILAAVLLVLGALATWDEWQTKQEQQQKEEESKLTDLDAAQVRKIVLVDRGKATAPDGDRDPSAPTEADAVAAPTRVELEQIDGVWRVTAPLETVADQNEVQDFIRTVLEYKYEETITAPDETDVDLQEYGLQEPQRTIKLTTADSINYELRLGRNAPVGYSTYFQVSGKELVYLGSQYVLNSTQKGLFDFRDKRLISLDTDQIKRITFWHRDLQVYEVVRQEGKFQLIKPEPFKTSQKKISEYIEAFDQVRAEKFIDQPDTVLVKKFKTATKIVMTAVFEFNSGESKELTFVRDRGELLASFAADKLVFGLPASFEEKVRNLSENFRDHSIFAFTVAEVTDIDIDGQNYRRIDNNWYRVTDLDAEGKLPTDNKPTPNDSVDLLLDSLETAEALEFVERKTVAKVLAQPPARRLTLQLQAADDEQRKLEIAFYTHPEKEDRFYVSHNANEQIYVAASSLLEAYTVSDEKSKESALSSDNASNSQGG